MGEAIGQTLVLAVGVALSPIPIVAVILMLVTPRARTNGPAYAVGYLLGLLGLGAVLLLLAGPADPSDDGEAATWVDLVRLGLGVLLLLLALKQWRGRPQAGDERRLPKWMASIESFTPPKAFGTGVALAGPANPKNLVLAVGAAAAIAQTGIEPGEQAVAYAVFALVGSIGVAIPVVILFALGDRAGPILGRLERTLADHNAAIMSAVLLLIGAKLVGDAIAGLG